MEDCYIINSDTLIVMPETTAMTKVIESDNELLVENNTNAIIEESCKYFGSSLLGRKEGSKYLLNCTYKLPIILDNKQELIIFPSMSPKEKDCCWISYNNIEKYQRTKDGSKIIFKNGKEIVLNMSFGSFENQYFRAMKLYTLIASKKVSSN